MNGIAMYDQTSNNITNYDALVLEHSSLVKKIAHHLMARLPASVQIDDLLQAGMVGLIEAAKNFDDTKGASFSTYAGIRIRGHMLDDIRKGDWVPRSVHRNTRRIHKAIRDIGARTGRDAKDYEIAKEMGVTLHEYHQILADSNSVRLFGFDDINIDENDHSNSLYGNLSTPHEGLQRDDTKNHLSNLISQLPEREATVLALYYEEELNLKEIGAVLSVSESRVSQLHSQALHRLRSKLSNWNELS